MMMERRKMKKRKSAPAVATGTCWLPPRKSLLLGNGRSLSQSNLWQCGKVRTAGIQAEQPIHLAHAHSVWQAYAPEFAKPFGQTT